MSRDVLLNILDLARWAPSGDNTQPWRFEIVADDQVTIHGFDTRDNVLYDFDGHPSHMAHGALLETLRIAATAFSLEAAWTVEADEAARTPRYHVQFSPTSGLARSDPLAPYIERRTVQRRPMRTTPLTDEQRTALIAAAGDNMTVRLFETWPQRLGVARLLWNSAYIRLTCPEAYSVHRAIIEWGSRFSEDRIPEQAVGVDPMTARLMQWVLGSWKRVDFFNRYLLGTIAPRVQLDVLPALFCAAHVLLMPKRTPETIEDWLNLGAAMQRMWLTATSLGLHLQPQMTPVIFRWYARHNRKFSQSNELHERASQLTLDFERLAQARAEQPFGFFCRVGISHPPESRSLRLAIAKLLTPPRH